MIINALLTAAIITLLLLILGVMREAVILDGKVTALSQLITRPPAPSYVNATLPIQLAERLSLSPLTATNARKAHVVLFVRPNCSGCEDVIGQLSKALTEGLVAREDISCVVSAASHNEPLYQEALTISQNAILDVTGNLLKSCEIRGTPTALALWSDTGHVFDYILGGDVEWIRQKAPDAARNCNCDGRQLNKTSRQAFLHWAGRLAIALTAAVGGLVKFTPTAWAANCIDSPQPVNSPNCATSCLVSSS